MPQRQAVPTVTIKTREAQGDDSWVVFRKPPHLLGYRSRTLERLEEQGVTFDAAGRAYGGQLTIDELQFAGIEQLADCLVDWNWVDDNGKPLPKPDPDDVDGTVQMFKDNLRRIEIDYLADKLAEFLERPGNSKRSKRSYGR